MEVIYDYVKAGRPAPAALVQGLIAHARALGADGVILGCTELSTLGLSARTDPAFCRLKTFLNFPPLLS